MDDVMHRFFVGGRKASFALPAPGLPYCGKVKLINVHWPTFGRLISTTLQC